MNECNTKLTDVNGMGTVNSIYGRLEKNPGTLLPPPQGQK